MKRNLKIMFLLSLIAISRTSSADFTEVMKSLVEDAKIAFASARNSLADQIRNLANGLDDQQPQPRSQISSIATSQTSSVSNPCMPGTVAVQPVAKQAPACFEKRLFNYAKSSFNTLTKSLKSAAKVLSEYVPSQEVLVKGSLIGVAGANAWQRYCQTRTAYNNRNINRCFSSGLLTAISTAGAIMANDTCRQKAGPLLSTLLIGGTALDIIYQKLNSAKISQLDINTVITDKTESQAVKCGKCHRQIMSCSNVNFTNASADILGNSHENICFPDGDSINVTSENSRTVVYCKECVG